MYSFEGPYYITGDMAEVDRDGCITFMGRDDDIILSAGYRIGPFDVESCLIEHPAVAESGVVGKADAEWQDTALRAARTDQIDGKFHKDRLEAFEDRSR